MLAVEACCDRLPERRHVVRVGHCDELRRRLLQPGGEVADLLHGNVLEAGVHPRVLGLLLDVEPVADVAVRRVAEPGEQAHGLARRLERDRLVQQERAARRVDHRGALIADDGIRDPRLLQVGPDRAEHPSRGHDDRDSCVLGTGDRCARPRPQKAVSAYEGAVEVAGERLHADRERGREENQPPVACVTYAATSAIC